MKKPWFLFLLLLLALLSGVKTRAGEPSRALELPASRIFSKGPNTFTGEVLEITKGRGSSIGWYVQAKQDENVDVFVEYTLGKPLDQAYQLSFDGLDQFWDVPITKGDDWGREKIGSFPLRSGTHVLIVLVPPSNRKYDHPLRFRKLVLEGSTPGNLSLATPPREPDSPDAAPGFGQKLTSLHPALSAIDLRDESLTLRISGMALRGPRELIFTTWDGDLFSFDMDASQKTETPKFRRLAQGLSEPMGLATTNGRIFVTEKNEVTELIDEDGDGTFETYRCVSHDWPCTMDYHEYLFGAVVQDGHLVFSSSVGMATRDRDNRQAPLRGSVIKVNLANGKTEVVAGGLRTPDGIGLGPGGSILITDNQGEWLPANKLIQLQAGGFYQFRSRTPWHPFDRPKATPPAVWLPQGEIANSPTEPILLPPNWGPYAGQVVFGDATFGGLQRAFLEEVDGVAQGAVFPFSQGFRHLFHRFEFNEDGDLFAGGIARGQDKDFIHRVSGLTRIRYTGKEVFEPLATRLRTNGLEVEFTLPLAPGTGWDPAGYYASQWTYQGVQTYGGPKVRHRQSRVQSATVSEDRRRVFLEIPGLVEGEVLHVRLPESQMSENGLSLWTGEFWFTVNRLPRENPGTVSPVPPNVAKPSTPYFRFSEGNAGRVLYRNYCASCHSLDGTKFVGPTFVGLVGATRNVREGGKLREIVADKKYIKHSILEPNAQLVDGFPANIMPPVGSSLTEKQIDALVSYVVKASDPAFAAKEVTQRQTINLAWALKDFPEVTEQATRGKSDFKTNLLGMQAFMKAQCLQCHAVSGFGSNIGPNLTESVKKIQGKKLLQQIVDPSSEIHAKYQTMQFVLDSGKIVAGVILKEDDSLLHVATNLLKPQELTTIRKSEIEEQRPSKVSAMPNGLINVLTKTEILDLLSYLESGPATIALPSTSKQSK